MAGLGRLYARAPDYYAKNVRFNCVLTRHSDIPEVVTFFSAHPLTRGHRVGYSTVSGSGEFNGISEEQSRYLYETFVRATRLSPAGPLDDVSLFMSKALQRIALRTRGPLKRWIHPNACCVPLLKKMHVAVDGNVYLCEHSPHSNSVGNVNDPGFTVDPAMDLLDRYVARSLPDCRVCWACRLCSACYQHSMRNGCWMTETRQSVCEGVRAGVLWGLVHYALALEESPEAFRHLQEMEFDFPI
jgi:radical SAM protein with 4Fe4S-binding SPASM domain